MANDRAKLKQIEEITGEDLDDLMENAVCDGVTVGICCNDDCDYICESCEPDMSDGYCEECGTPTVKSVLILAHAI